MEWLSYLLLLICPLMMIFCMKGLFGGHHNHKKSDVTNDLEQKVRHLEEDNKQLQRELEHLTKIFKKDY
jgi:hypothetical protein